MCLGADFDNNPNPFKPMNIETILNWMLKMMALAIAYISPILTLINLVLALIVIDLMTGTYASIKHKEKFSARKLRHTVEKFVFYSVAIIAGYLLQCIFAHVVNVSQLVAGYIAFTEAKSIYENTARITNIDLFGLIWDAIKEKLPNLKKYENR